MWSMKYRIVVELALHEEEIIGAKEQIAALLEGIGSTKVVEIRKVEEVQT